MRRRTLGVCFFMLGTLAYGQDPLPPNLRGAEKLEALISRVSQVQAATTTLEASFVQRRMSRLLSAPSVSTGKFYYRAPDTVRWEYASPRPMTVFIADKVAITYRPAEKRAERVEVGRAQRRVFRFLGATAPLETLKQYFSFTFRDRGQGHNYILTLKPTTHMIKKRLSEVVIEIDPASFVPVAVSYTEADGDATFWEFSDVRRNQPIPASLLRFEIPAGTEVVDLKLHDREE